MTDGPLPPHERPWRHPSELAAAPLEPPTRAGRLLIVSTATVSLLLVGVLAVTMTPGKARNPQAFLDSTLVETTLVAAAASELAAAVATVPLIATSVGPRASERVSVPARPAPATTTHGDDTTAGPVGAASATTLASPVARRPVIVTPVGDGLAITTQAAMGPIDDAASATPMPAALPSGSPVHVDVVATQGDLVIVSILTGSTGEDRSLAGAPGDDTTGSYVLVDGTRARFNAAIFPPPRVPEGAPIVDDDGRVLGLATHNRTGLELLVVSTLPPVDGSPVDSEPPPASSEPADPPTSSPGPEVTPGSEPLAAGDGTSTTSSPTTSTSTTASTASTTSSTVEASTTTAAPTTTTSD